jgi:hypothetical protein
VVSIGRLRRWVWVLIVVATFSVLVHATKGPPAPTENPPGTFAFGAFGDAPYHPWETWRYPLVLQDMDGNDLAFSIHVGDIFWYPCSDEMYPRPESSLGRSTVTVDTQSAHPAFAEFVEHARWSQHDVVFTTLHVVGSGNATQPFPGRTDADDQAARRRVEAALTWLHESFAHATSQSATAVIVAFHANPGFD